MKLIALLFINYSFFEITLVICRHFSEVSTKEIKEEKMMYKTYKKTKYLYWIFGLQVASLFWNHAFFNTIKFVNSCSISFHQQTFLTICVDIYEIVCISSLGSSYFLNFKVLIRSIFRVFVPFLLIFCFMLNSRDIDLFLV